MEWINKYFDEIDNFPRPNWEKIYNHVEKHHKDDNQDKLWCNVAHDWMQKLKSKLSNDYQIHESENYILVTSESDRYVTLLQGFLESTLKKILSTLEGIASDEGYGKYVVIVFNDIDDYYSYMTYYYPEDGVFGLSSGVYLNNGYGHFVFPHQDVTYAESITAHEMTHSLLVHLPIPSWLNEGIAVTIEDMITGSAPLRMDNELFERHKAFWGTKEIQEFWSGEAFHRPDEGQELSYHLAQFAVKSLSHDYEDFSRFVNKANYEDGGESAANDVFGGGLGGLISQFFGDGDWAPNPQEWKQEDTNKSSNLTRKSAVSLHYTLLLRSS